MIDNAAVFSKNKAGCTWVSELDALDHEAHSPFHKSQVPRYGDIVCFEEYIVAASDQAILSTDVCLNTLLFLGWVDEMHIFSVNSSPLLGGWACFAIGLCEQLTKRFSIRGGWITD